MTSLPPKLKGSVAERVRYFPRQLMTVEDMRAEQDYFVERMRRHNRLFHGWGIICGLEVKPYATADKPWQVMVCPGSACAATGDEIHVSTPVPFDLARPPETEDDCTPCPCPPGPPLGAQPGAVATYYLAIRYLCRPARPVRTGNTNCGCGDEGCEASRWRDDFELALLTKLEGPYAEDAERTAKEKEWLEHLRERLARTNSLFGLLTRPCWPPTEYPWIILMTLPSANLSAPPPGDESETLNERLNTAITEGGVRHRRPLLQVQDLLRLFAAPTV